MKALVALALAFLTAAPALAAVKYRRPYEGGYRLNYGFDNKGGGGCKDYGCGGACYDTHTGADFGTPFGTEVVAGAAGKVIARVDGCANYGGYGNTCGGRCGNYVQLQHADGSKTIYCHMKKGSIAVRHGQQVKCGQTLGRSASSGSSTGPHLHFGWKPPGWGSSRDPFAGRCSHSGSAFAQQRGYREAPGTACPSSPPPKPPPPPPPPKPPPPPPCKPVAEACNGKDDDCDKKSDEDEVCEIEMIQRLSGVYAAPTTSDVNGDRLADVCARSSGGVHCWPARGGKWTGAVLAVPWSNASGWSDPTNYATIRLGDVNGDGKADVCGRGNDGIFCALSKGEQFAAATLWKDGISDRNSWNLPRFYTTLRLADANGDGRDDLCARDAAGFGCWLSDGTKFERRMDGPNWGDAQGFGSAKYYGTLRMDDVNGDGKADVCIRHSQRFDCWLSNGTAFATGVTGPEWSNAGGWDDMKYWSTIRLADVNGDGKADACARGASSLACWLSNGRGFPTAVTVHPLADAAGWGDPTNYSTIRVGDVNGDGRDDLCARSDSALQCWAHDGTAFRGIMGPPWADSHGWKDPKYHDTIRLADMNGDNMADVCARAGAGWRCHTATGAGFSAGAVELGNMAEANGWGHPMYHSTIISGGTVCKPRPEICNGRDDDCDGQVDEDRSAELCNGRDDDCDGQVDEEKAAEICNGRDDDCDGQVDENAVAEVCNGRDDDCDGQVDEHAKAETCNGEDDDCDGDVDEHAVAETCNGADDDCDGEVDEHATDEVCNGRDDDCDGAVDEHATEEICNGVDDDCDGEVDESVQREICNGKDDDCDGQVDENARAEFCNGVDDDCNGEVDEHATVEVCNRLDDDCDGLVDEHAKAEICNGIDDDCDGRVDEHRSRETCNGIDDDCNGRIDEHMPPGGCNESNQCNASSALPEVCNGRDDDCDGQVDELATAEACNGRDDDCDGEIDEHVRAEVCNGVDDDCDGEIDEHRREELCNDLDDDCDGDIDEHAMREICNGVDDDCDGRIDEVCGGADAGTPDSGSPDAGAPDAGPAQFEDEGGCASTGGAHAALAAVAVLGFVVRRRRR